jgi:hypothetical protein
MVNILCGCQVERTIHEDSLCDIIRVVSSDNVINFQTICTSVERLPAKDAAECTIILLSYLCNYGIHGPAIEFIIREYLERYIILLLVPFNGLDYARSM